MSSSFSLLLCTILVGCGPRTVHFEPLAASDQVKQVINSCLEADGKVEYELRTDSARVICKWPPNQP